MGAGAVASTAGSESPPAGSGRIGTLWSQVGDRGWSLRPGQQYPPVVPSPNIAWPRDTPPYQRSDLCKESKQSEGQESPQVLGAQAGRWSSERS